MDSPEARCCILTVEYREEGQQGNNYRKLSLQPPFDQYVVKFKNGKTSLDEGELFDWIEIIIDYANLFGFQDLRFVSSSAAKDEDLFWGINQVFYNGECLINFEGKNRKLELRIQAQKDGEKSRTIDLTEFRDKFKSAVNQKLKVPKNREINFYRDWILHEPGFKHKDYKDLRFFYSPEGAELAKDMLIRNLCYRESVQNIADAYNKQGDHPEKLTFLRAPEKSPTLKNRFFERTWVNRQINSLFNFLSNFRKEEGAKEKGERYNNGVFALRLTPGKAKKINPIYRKDLPKLSTEAPSGKLELSDLIEVDFCSIFDVPVEATELTDSHFVRPDYSKNVRGIRLSCINESEAREEYGINAEEEGTQAAPKQRVVKFLGIIASRHDLKRRHYAKYFELKWGEIVYIDLLRTAMLNPGNYTIYLVDENQILPKSLEFHSKEKAAVTEESLTRFYRFNGHLSSKNFSVGNEALDIRKRKNDPNRYKWDVPNKAIKLVAEEPELEL